MKPGELVVLQLGIRFAIELPDGPSRGYVVEVFSGHFQLPELGPIGMLFQLLFFLKPCILTSCAHAFALQFTVSVNQ